MNILFAHYDPEIQTEIDEFLKLMDAKIYFSINTEETIRILNDHAIEMVILKINNMRDASVLKYINDNYADLEVLILASKEYDEIISAFIRGHFTLIQQPVKLAELKKNIANLIELRVSIRNNNSQETVPITNLKKRRNLKILKRNE